MLRVRFFASVREALACDGLEVPWSGNTGDLDGLQDELCTVHGSRWREVLTQDNIIRAVNHTVVPGNVALADGDEVAFYPPVSGG